MKTSALISLYVSVLSVLNIVPTAVTARPMHAGIDYQRYLAEKEATHAEWKAWEEKHGANAMKMGLIPTSEERSSIDYEEDMRQRIFLSKQDVKRAQATNPDANFSIDVVYSIMTKEEFATKIMNSFATGNATITRLSSQKPTHKPTTEAATVTQTVDWTKSACMSPIQNQGQCGDCWAFAAAAAVESAQCIAGGQNSLHKLSEQQLVSCNTQNRGCSGGAPQYAFEYILKQGGLCTEAAFPYASVEGQTPSCISCIDTQTGVKGYKVLDEGDEAGLIEAINERPTVVTVAAGNEAWKQYVSGVLSSCDTNTLDHLVVAVGYDPTSLKIRNSWGDQWGEDGYIRLKRGSDTCSVLQQMVPLEV